MKEDIDFYNAKQYREAHDYHFSMFIKSRDFKHFEAAKAIAAKIIKYEDDMKAYRFSMDLKDMYIPKWN